METSTQLTYPPIARAAHVIGVVIVRADLDGSGAVEHAEVWNGPIMLRKASLDFVQGFHANPYGSSRTCLISVTYQMRNVTVPKDFHGDTFGVIEERTSSAPLHYGIVGRIIPLDASHPSFKIVRHRFLGIF